VITSRIFQPSWRILRYAKVVRACCVLDHTNAAADLWIRTVLKFLISSAVMTPMEWNAGQTHVKYLALGSCTIKITRMDRALISSHHVSLDRLGFTRNHHPLSSSIIRHGCSSSSRSSWSSSRFSSIIRHGSSSSRSSWSSSRFSSIIRHGSSSSRSSWSSSRFSSIIRHASSSRSSYIHWGSSSRSNSFIIHGGSSSRSSFITY